MYGLMLTAAVMAAAPANPDEEIASLGASLAQLRAEVDGLSADVTTARAQAREEQLALARRRAALEGDLESARMLAAELRTRLDALERSSADKTTAAAALVAPIADALRRVRAVIEGGAPFQTKARLLRVDAVDAMLTSAPPDPVAALAALAPVLAEEAKLARTTQRARQPITVEGEQVVADVIRIGTVAVLFRTPKGAVGYAAAGGAWRTLTNEADRERVQEMFALYRKDAPNRVLLVPREALPQVVAPTMTTATATATSSALGGAR